MPVTREQFLAFTPAAPKPVDVPDLGTVYVRVISALERERFEKIVTERPNSMRAAMVAFCTCDESGKLLFDPADIDDLNKLPFPTLYPIHQAALQMNRIGEDEKEELQGN